MIIVAVTTAAVLAWASFSTHLERACTTRDTPYLPLCPEAGKDPEELRSELRDYVRLNPGDAFAWSRLLAATPQEDEASVLRAATELAPGHANVLRRRAAAALQQARWDEAVALLVQMLRMRETPDAGKVLAQIVGSGQGQLLRPHLDSANKWLPLVLHYMAAEKVPQQTALPLVAEAAAKGTISEWTLGNYVQTLKSQRQWSDAYGLWIVRHKQEVPLLYNPAFDTPFETGGFDWESEQGSRSRAGVLVKQQRFSKRGGVLDVEFTGRSFNMPIVRQFVFAAPEKYRLQGEFMASKVKSEGGLVWKVVCPEARNRVLAESEPLRDTGGAWKAFEFVFSLPADCGPMASIQLEPAAGFEAQAGMRGRYAFDAFELSAAGAKP